MIQLMGHVPACMSNRNNAGRREANRPLKIRNESGLLGSPPFSREDITNLPNYKAIARVLAGGEPTRPFLFETTPRL